MSRTLTIDTLDFANRLKEVGVPDKQAERQAELLAEMVNDKLASRNDLVHLKKDLQIELADMKNELIKWVIGTVFGVSLAQTAIIISCLKLIH
jgi:hypothetical protein